MFTSEGLDLRTVTPDQWPVVQKALNRQSANLLLDPEARIIITATREPADKQFDYNFRATSDAAPEAEARWHFTTPKYVEPPKPEPKKEAKPKEGDKPPSADLDKPAQ